MTTHLSNAARSFLSPEIKQGRYDRHAMQGGIVHLGVGNFHRAHQAVYIDDILNSGDHRWGIIGASLNRPDIRDALKPQDYLYTLGIKSGDQSSWRIIGSIRSMIFARETPRALITAIASPSTRIVSLTITEKAYCLDGKTGLLDETDPFIRHDLQNPHQPATAIGYLITGLKTRIDMGHSLPPIVSCDNLTSNGIKLRHALIRFAELQDQEFAKRLGDNLVCPSTMVDRIVPQTQDEDRQDVVRATGLIDSAPVMTEPFTQWVIEDQFPLGRPEWEPFGVQCVSDVRPYERMKLGLLNASHTMLAILGLLAGHETVADTMRDSVLTRFISGFMRDDAAPALALPVAMNIDAYVTSLLDRFQNTALRHRLLQIASDSSQKLPQRLLPIIQTRLKHGQSLGRLAYGIAGFLMLIEIGMDERPHLRFQDPRREALSTSIRKSSPNDEAKLLALLAHQDIFGDLKDNSRACREICTALVNLRQNGVHNALQQHFM